MWGAKRGMRRAGRVGHDGQAWDTTAGRMGRDQQGVVRGVSAGTVTDAPGSALVVVVGLRLQQWGQRGLADGGVHKGEARGGGGRVSGQVAEGAAWAAGEGGGGTGAMDGCGGTRDRAEVCMGGPGHVGQPGTRRKGS